MTVRPETVQAQMGECVNKLRQQMHRLLDVNEYERQLLTELQQFKNAVRSPTRSSLQELAEARS